MLPKASQASKNAQKLGKTPFWCQKGVFHHFGDIIVGSKFSFIFKKYFKMTPQCFLGPS
jgi:hypothetical protein